MNCPSHVLFVVVTVIAALPAAAVADGAEVAAAAVGAAAVAGEAEVAVAAVEAAVVEGGPEVEAAEFAAIEDAAAVEDVAVRAVVVVEDGAEVEAAGVAVVEGAAEAVVAVVFVAALQVLAPSVWRHHCSSLLGPQQTSSVAQLQLVPLSSPHQ